MQFYLGLSSEIIHLSKIISRIAKYHINVFHIHGLKKLLILMGLWWKALSFISRVFFLKIFHYFICYLSSPHPCNTYPRLFICLHFSITNLRFPSIHSLTHWQLPLKVYLYSGSMLMMVLDLVGVLGLHIPPLYHRDSQVPWLLSLGSFQTFTFCFPPLCLFFLCFCDLELLCCPSFKTTMP